MIHFLNNLNTFYTENRKIEFKISDWLQRNDWFRIHYSSMTKQLKILRNAAGPKFNKNLSQLVNIIFNLLGWEHIQTSTFDDFHSRSYTILRNLNLKKVICTFSGTTKKKDKSSHKLFTAKVNLIFVIHVLKLQKISYFGFKKKKTHTHIINNFV